MFSNDPLTNVGLIIIALCLVAAVVAAVLSIWIPGAGQSPLLTQLFRMSLFLFSVGAVAVLFKALG